MNANDRHLKLNIQDQMEAVNQAKNQHEITISKHTILSDGLEIIKGPINNNRWKRKKNKKKRKQDQFN